MASDELIRRLIGEISGLRQDLQTLIYELQQDRESKVTAPSPPHEPIDTREEMSNHNICNRLAVFLHYYHMVREESKKRKIRLNSLGRNSLFAIMYQAYCPNDYDRIICHNGNMQTTLEKNFNDRMHYHFNLRLNQNKTLIPYFEVDFDKLTKEHVANAFIVDLEGCRDYVAYPSFVQVIHDILS